MQSERPRREPRGPHGPLLRWTVATSALVALLLGAVPAAAIDAGDVVVIDRYQALPRVVRITAGGRVTFVVHENETLLDNMIPLTVVFDAGFARSPALEPGESWTIELVRPGVYDYHLEEHDAIEGTVIVE